MCNPWLAGGHSRHRYLCVICAGKPIEIVLGNMSRDFQPLPPSPEALMSCKSLYLQTDLGQLDVLSEITGIGNYSEVAQHVISIDLGGLLVRVLNLDALILSSSQKRR
jgi:hypothetical protein